MTTTDDDSAASIQNVLSKPGVNIHLLGICGVGMAGLAVLLKSQGFNVSGCDEVPGAIGDWLTEQGITVLSGHDPTHINDTISWVVRSPAVSCDSTELLEARNLDIPVFRRGEVLPAILPESGAIAVAGTHGKTTVSSFIAQILATCGRSPSFCIGGVTESLGGVACVGEGDSIVVEADESDGTVALYTPSIAVITNVEPDHMENFDSDDSLYECFTTFVDRTTGTVVYCADDPGACRAAEGARSRISYGMTDNADIRAVDLKMGSIESSFVIKHGASAVTVTVPVIGRHNIINALAAVAACTEVGLELEEIGAAMADLSLARRRFDRAVSSEDIVVISDYAHHPTEVTALLEAAQLLNKKRVRTLFQPHRYTRTKALAEDFAGAFAGTDELILLPVYSASETPMSGGSVWDLYSALRRREDHTMQISVAESMGQAWNYLKHTAEDGDAILIVGAGDIEQIAAKAAAEWGNDGEKWDHGTSFKDAAAQLSAELTSSELRIDERIGGKTTLHVGGRADLWAEIGSIEDFLTVASWCSSRELPLHVIGGGSNILVSDLGVRGVVARLTGAEFRDIKKGQGVITVGASTAIGSLLNWCAEQGLGGLEFMDGIPGTVGGAVRMNAGAWGEEICTYLAWVKCVGADGSEEIITDPEVSYRTGVSDGTIVQVGLAVKDVPADESRQLRARAAERRAWMKGKRSAGSVFMNPEDDFAGRMIEQCGLKGLAVGGAVISEEHANMITVDGDASSSDVRAIMERMRSAVQEQFGVVLKEEVIILG